MRYLLLNAHIVLVFFYSIQCSFHGETTTTLASQLLGYKQQLCSLNEECDHFQLDEENTKKLCHHRSHIFCRSSQARNKTGSEILLGSNHS